ncbi:MAG TPA: helix-turn-helix transcriptional regulator [Rhizobiaceae bacterium]|nr:helix-turn-helix transcriptional regulator [Rhizobiaceae bacterium]
MDVRSLVAWNLRRLRVAKNISQDELALLSEVERAYVGHLERGTKNPTIDTLAKLAAALECEIMELFRAVPSGARALKPLKGGRRKS